MFDMTDAACATAPLEVFFPEGRNKREQEYAAKVICASCPIQEQCLRYAIENSELGIWGGTTEEERKHIRL